MRERSLREARAIARLNNINVVRVFDVLRTTPTRGSSWSTCRPARCRTCWPADGPLPPVRAAEIGLGVLNALRAAHRAGVLHRDVKPGNVLIGEDGRVVLTDFGLATVPGDPNVTRTGLVLGSPAYIAPERARDGTAGPGADLWSLGATLYAAVEGASPFARPVRDRDAGRAGHREPAAGPQRRPAQAGAQRPAAQGSRRTASTPRRPSGCCCAPPAAGRSWRFPMSPTMRRPGVGRERPALPGTPPAGRARPASAASGSAPVVPGSAPAGLCGRRRPGRSSTPGKAAVGRPAMPAAETSGRPAADTSARPAADTSARPAADTSARPAAERRGGLRRRHRGAPRRGDIGAR